MKSAVIKAVLFCVSGLIRSIDTKYNMPICQKAIMAKIVRQLHQCPSL